MAATITVICPQCKNKMKASSQHIGRQGRCPACNALVPIKGGESDAAVTLLPDDPSQRATGRHGVGATDVDPWPAAAIGLTVTLLLYVIFILLYNQHYRLGEFMVHNWAQPALTFVCCWATALLIMKYRAVQRQLVDPERELELIPLDIGMQITAGNVDEFLGHLNRLPAQRQDSILLRRIRGAMEYFKFRNSVPEVQSYLSTQAEIDASGVDSGYTLLRAFIWVCPILGFVGTVVGISEAIGGLRNSMQPTAAASDVSAPVEDLDFNRMKEGMKEVTKGLATAFDTTLYGLVATIFLLFPTELLRKSEYAALDKIEMYANESLLRRMSEGGPALDKDPVGFAREALQAAFQQHQQWLAQWQDQVARLGQTIGGKFEISLREVVQKLTQEEGARLDRMGQLARSLDHVLGEAHRGVEAVGRASSQSSNEAERAALTMSEVLDRMSSSAQVLERILDQQQRVAGANSGGVVLAAVDALRRDVQSLTEGIHVPSPASPDVLPQPVLVSEPEKRPSDDGAPRRGWFSTVPPQSSRP